MTHTFTQHSSIAPKRFGKVALLMGGWSAEREVSLNSGKAIFDALKRSQVDVHAIDATPERVMSLKTEGFDCVFNIMHGRGGEDGVVQSALELQGLPYTGTGVLGSALSMDKLRTKRLWAGMGLPTPEYRVMHSAKEADAIVKALGLPLMVKPTLEGSSVGMSKVTQASDLPSAYELASQYGSVFVEQWIFGKEYTAAVLNTPNGLRPLPLIRLETNQDFYDYAAKYERNDTEYHCPCGLDDEEEQSIQSLALDAFNAVSATGWGRVDLMVDEASGKHWLIEVNTVPGMTDHSLVPMAAKQAGLSFDELVMHVLANAVLEGGSHG